MAGRKKRKVMEEEKSELIRAFVEEPIVIWLGACRISKTFQDLLRQADVRRALVEASKNWSSKFLSLARYRVVIDFLLEDASWNYDVFCCILRLRDFLERMDEVKDDPADGRFALFEAYPTMSLLMAKHYGYYPSGQLLIDFGWNYRDELLPAMLAVWQAYPLQCPRTNPTFQLDRALSERFQANHLFVDQPMQLIDRCAVGVPFYVLHNAIDNNRTSLIWCWPSTIIVPNYTTDWQPELPTVLVIFQWQRVCARAYIQMHARFPIATRSLLFSFLSLFSELPSVVDLHSGALSILSFAPSLAHLTYGNAAS